MCHAKLRINKSLLSCINMGSNVKCHFKSNFVRASSRLWTYNVCNGEHGCTLADPGWAEPPVCGLLCNGNIIRRSCCARDAHRNLTTHYICCRSSRRARGAFNNLSALFHSSSTGRKNSGKPMANCSSYASHFITNLIST